jgi:UDP-N-acetylmuramoyl-tripeptide--D-alanyl-D-alanine ligase
VPGRNGATIIDDSYNANPGSVHAALDHLAGLSGRRILVFGNMAELGPAAPELHKEIGEYARGRCDLLFAIGDLASEAAKTFGAAGCRIADIDSARAALDPLLGQAVTVLVKGSRVMGLDRLVKLLEADSTKVT